LYTDHGAPLNEDQVEGIISDEIRAWAKTRSSGNTKNRGAGAAHAASRGSAWNRGGLDDEWATGEAESIIDKARIKAVGGMTAAAHGIVDGSAFETRLMGGFAVLKDGRDPLYTMQATANVASVLALAWTMVALMFAWRDGDLDWWWLFVSVGLSATTCLVIALEMLLSHDAELLHRITRFARTFQLVLVSWLWGLLLWSSQGDLNLRGAEPFLEVVVVWVTMFTGIEIFSRFKLGQIRWNGGSALDKLKGVTAVLTEAEMTEMKANSSQIMATVRWALHGLTLAWLCVLLAFGQGIGPETLMIEEWGRPTLWLAAMYALMFGSESWLRMRGRMPEA
jgi:hypothetical protein